MPDLAWSTEALYEVPCTEGHKYIHIGTVSGMPVKDFFGVAPTGRGFKVLAIDVHWVVDGKLKETWHCEEWLS